ncbi:hypothetical protein FF2_018206 [Malus domestica]
MQTASMATGSCMWLLTHLGGTKSRLLSAKQLDGLTVARTWAFSDGDYMPLQFSPGSYNEHMFKVPPFILGLLYSLFFLSVALGAL